MSGSVLKFMWIEVYYWHFLGKILVNDCAIFTIRETKRGGLVEWVRGKRIRKGMKMMGTSFVEILRKLRVGVGKGSFCWAMSIPFEFYFSGLILVTSTNQRIFAICACNLIFLHWLEGSLSYLVLCCFFITSVLLFRVERICSNLALTFFLVCKIKSPTGLKLLADQSDPD